MLLESKGPDLPISALFHNSAIYENMDLYNSVNDRRNLSMEKEDLKCTIESINHILGKSLVFRPESLPMDSMGTGAVSDSNTTSNQNVSDIMGAGLVVADAGKSMSLNNGQSGILPIEDFLDRPVEIATGTIAVGAAISANYPVWDLVTKHPSVRAKVKNFAFMRCNMVVRVAFAGSPFHTGRVLLSYQPHAGKNRNLIAHTANLAAAAAYRPMLLNYLSQADGARVLDVRANTPVEIRIPFISPKPMARLFNATSSAIAAATSFTDFADMGTLYVYTINSVGSVSASSASPVGYSIFAWLEDVELSVPTATQLAITTESFKMSSKDERETGPVERVSSALVELSEVCCAIPEIAPFAYPAQIVFRGVNALAAHYGWSRPNIVSEPTYVKNRPVANSAVCIGSETVELLSYDPKRGLASDSHACGSGMDDMCIATVAQRESYIETFTWAASDAAYTSIKELIVHPQMNSYYVDAGATPCTMVQPSAMSFAVTPFNFWRGDIIFRLDFVTSQYHRGKFAIWYEPNHHHQALISADLALNKNDVQIIDIAETNSVEIVVQWANSFPWLKTLAYNSIKGVHNPGPLLLNLTDVVNGHIIMAPFVPLQSPDDSDVQINVFVRAENLLVNELGGSMPVSRVYITPESYVVQEDKSCEEVTKFVLNPSSASVEDITKHYFGEIPLSFRACLKRYVTVETQNYAATGTHMYLRVHRAIMPPIAPLYNVGTPLASPIFPTLYGYLRYAYLGLRGGVRSRLRLYQPDVSSEQAIATVGLLQPVDASAPIMGEVNSPVRLNHNGHVQYVPSITGIAEVELPFYTNNNFVFSFAEDLMGSAVEGAMSRTWTKDFSYNVENRGVISDNYWFIRDFAVAEDFTLMRYQGAPYYTY